MSSSPKATTVAQTDKKKASFGLDKRYYFALAFGVASLLGVILISVFLVRPLVDHLLSTSKDLQYRTQEETLLKQKVTDLQKLKQNYDSLGDDTRQKILVAMPTDADESHLTSLLSTVASQSGVILSAINYSTATAAPATTAVGAPAATSGSATQTTLSVTGPYASINNFLVNVEKAPRVIDVTSVQISGTSPQLTAQMTLSARFNPAGTQ